MSSLRYVVRPLYAFGTPTDKDMQAKLAELTARAMASAPPRCSALIDQGRFIGGDPVGHACPADGTGRFDHPEAPGVYWPVCQACLEMLREGGGRVDLPGWMARMDGGAGEPGAATAGPGSPG